MGERSIWAEVRTIIPFFAHFSVKAHRLRRFRSIPEVAAPQIGERGDQNLFALSLLYGMINDLKNEEGFYQILLKSLTISKWS